MGGTFTSSAESICAASNESGQTPPDDAWAIPPVVGKTGTCVAGKYNEFTASIGVYEAVIPK
jgi:hypothetical protein